MGCTVRDKPIRTVRRVRSGSTRTDSDGTTHPCCHGKSKFEPGSKPLAYELEAQLHHHLVHHQHHHHHAHGHTCQPPAGSDESTWVEEVLMKNLEFLYKEAIGKLVGLGYDEEAVMEAVLANGHCYGEMDALTNVLHNSLSYLNSEEESGGLGFRDLRQLEEYSLAGLVGSLQQARPNLSRGDAMWCLLMSDLHVGRASSMEIPSDSGNGSENVSNTVPSGADSTDGNGVGVVSPALCRFHGGWGFGSAETGLQKDIYCPKRFNLSPSMKSLLKRNAAAFAAGFRANPNYVSAPSQGQKDDKSEESQDTKNTDGVSSVLSKFRDLNLDDSAGEGQKDEMILTLVHQIKDLERQVKERKEWAHQKAMQAARKLSNDLTELKLLRMDREETQRLKKGKPTLEDSTMKRLSEMENALRKACGQVDQANAAERRLETENAEIRAEMEAFKLSASESVTTCLEAAKREKKYLKKLLAWEKQKTKLQEEITVEKEKIIELQRCLALVKSSQKDAEDNWRQEVKKKMATSMLSTGTIAAVNTVQGPTMMAFGAKSAFPVTRKAVNFGSIASNSGTVKCMQVWPPLGLKKFETLSYLPPLSVEELSKEVDYLIRNGWIPCLEFSVTGGFVHREHGSTPGYYDGRYWTMWKLPMFGCTDSSQVIKELEEAKKAYPQSFVRIIGFDNKRQVQCVSFIAYKPPGY